MNGRSSDASTSTDDIKARPLCLFYFTHPFGVLSPEPPTLVAPPAHVARAFLNMQPVPTCDTWSTNADSYASQTSSTSRPRAHMDLTTMRRDSLSSELFSTDLWLNSSSSCKSNDYPRRLLPYNVTLPPLRLPTPLDSSNMDSLDDLWPKKFLNPEKFSLPPIEFPTVSVKVVQSEASVSPEPEQNRTVRARVRRIPGVRKPRRTVRASDLRRALAALMRRALVGADTRGRGSPALRAALRTLRAAWPEPRSLRVRCEAAEGEQAGAMPRARPDASPGLLRRRYSVPETVMRRYRLAQQRSDSEQSAPTTDRWAASTSPTPGDSHRPVRRDREFVRRSALLRRAAPRACCCCGETPREVRSLGTSRAELRPLSAGWSTPKRQRLDSREARAPDEMLRAAMRNSYERTALAHCAYHTPSYVDNLTEPFTDSDVSKFDEQPTRDTCIHLSQQYSSDITHVDINSPSTEEARLECALSDPPDLEHSDSTDTPSALLCTTQDLVLQNKNDSKEVDEHIIEDLLPYEKPLTVDTTTSYDVLEIVVSEMLNVTPDSTVTVDVPRSDKFHPNSLKMPSYSQRKAQNINIDEYVSNILVESLNSLTDQLECMNASIGSDRKISIVEKEIKVKLQNTGVNTIVHLSPTSNNQIIFGNEELCNEEGCGDACNNNTLNIRDEPLSIESNNNVTSDPLHCPCESFDIHHDNVNQAVLQQIQKLFKDELHNLAPGDTLSTNMGQISHIEISNVDVYIDNARRDSTRSPDEEQPRGHELIGAVGASNYYPPAEHNPVVPRFSALPHTDSMEVNTSSSDDADFIGSDCTSLVDSLDDPNSPRSVLMRRAYSGKRGELVRSAIDVLDLLPENVRNEETPPPRDKPESFFIGIKDDECDCDKENVNVADRMPEKIKQRLYRRHRRREQRMECARRTRSGGTRARLVQSARARRQVERDCAAIVNALIDDVIAKIAQDEYKCMRIKRRPTRMHVSKSDENVTSTKRSWRKNLDPIDGREPFKAIKNGSAQLDGKEKPERHQIYGKLSLRPAPPSEDRTAKRIYQKSEIHDGNKCIEILEILEYVNGSQSSPEAVTPDENQNICTKNKKSRIPVPISERGYKSPGGVISRGEEMKGNTNKLTANMLLQALGEHVQEPSARRGSVSGAPPRFRQLFEVIPEERSSLSMDSGAEDSNSRRASAPDLVHRYREPPERECDAVPHRPAPPGETNHSPAETKNINKHTPLNEGVRKVKETFSVATSPMSDKEDKRRTLELKHQTTMTSPSSKSAATSPVHGGGASAARRVRLPAAGVRVKAAEPDVARVRRSSLGTQVEARRNVRAGVATTLPGRMRNTRTQSCERLSSHEDTLHSPVEQRDSRTLQTSVKRNNEPLSGSAERDEDAGAAGTSSDSSSGALCPLAPRWLRSRRPPRAPPVPPAPSAPNHPPGWSVTVAGSCGAALPADVEMRLRFPPATTAQECACRHCETCTCDARTAAPSLPPAPAPTRSDSKLTLTMKKEALDSSILASKSSRKSNGQLPEVETYRASRSKLKSSVKARRGCSPHCWLPDGENAPLRARNGLSVLGCAIIPELKPRVPTMSERDLTRVYTPRHFLRS